jgi:polar amino acid transport system substrate-binding protein
VRRILGAALAVGLAVGVLAAPVGAQSGKGDLKVGTNLPAPGFWDGDSPTAITGGFEYEMAKDIAKQLGYSGVKVVSVSFDALVAGKAKGFDMALSQVSITPERAKVVSFSTPYFRSDNGIMVKKGVKVPDAAAARKLKWGVQTGTTQQAFLQDKLKVTSKPRVYQETSQMFAALQAGQVDAVTTDTSILLEQAAQPGSTFEVVGQFKTNTGLYGAIFPKGSKLRGPVNKAIKSLKADGTLDQLVQDNLVAEFGGDPTTVPYLPL